MDMKFPLRSDRNVLKLERSGNVLSTVKYIVCVFSRSVVFNSETPWTVHRIFQIRILLEWVAISSSRGSSQPRDQTCVSCVSCIAGGFFTC